MNRSLRLTSWPNLFLAAYVALIAVLLFATPAHAATPTVTAPNVTVAENIGSGLIPFKLVKTVGLSYSKVRVQTVDGTAKAGVDYGALDTIVTLGRAAQTWSLPLGITNRAGYQGNRAFTVRLTCTRNCTAQASPATVMIVESDPAPIPTPAPTPHPCYDYSGTTPLGAVEGSNCPARMCPGYANPVPWEQPCPSVTPTPAAAPFSMGSLVTRQGLVYRVATNGIPDPFIRPTGPVIYGVQYVSDTTGHYYLADDPGLKQEIQYFYDVNLTPAP